MSRWFKKWEDCSKEELIENLRKADAYNADSLCRILRLETILSDRNICPKWN